MAKIVLKIVVLIVTLCFVTGEATVTDGDTLDSNDHVDVAVNNSLNVPSPTRRFTDKHQHQQHWYENIENTERIFRNKADILSRLLKVHIDNLRNQTEQVELVFLLDASASVGQQNFNSELSFMRKLLSDFTVDPSRTRVAVVTFGGKRSVIRNVDQISHTDENVHKCYLLNKQLNNISYTGGGTYTRGALLEALAILEKGRKTAKKVIFLITDGFSNGGNPRPAANLLKAAGVIIFTFGIRTGNIQELHDVATAPGYTHSYLLDSFAQFEALARRALHRDLKTGEYVSVNHRDDCDFLCFEGKKQENNELNCCDNLADCACGTATGHYACICPTGYFGSGFKGFCQPCPNGTYASGLTSGDSTLRCIPCPDVNHVTLKAPATVVEDCTCPPGFTTDGYKCEVITCPKLRVPENGYLVKASACNNVVNAACGIRCRIGFHLTGDSIRLCGKNGSWSGDEPQCQLKTCQALRAPTHGRIHCQHDENCEYKVKEDSTTYPIDTRCQFKCEIGYQLRGSKVRNCLPLSRWDGLKVACKAITCDPLLEISNGVISPDVCLGPEKVPFSTNCTITCNKGFSPEGPRSRVCNSKTGVWSQRHVSSRCIDKTPPNIICPSDIIAENIPGENYAYINQTEPEVSDNTDTMPTIWTKPHVVFPWKVKVGTRTLIYIAQDSSGNKARCKFKIRVQDREPPTVENCINPPVFFTDLPTGMSNVTWDEPVFYDNSKLPVHVTQSHSYNSTNFPMGTTKVVYNATDKYDNFATCVINITVKDVCESFSTPFNGKVTCHTASDNSTECEMTCNTGYDFVANSTDFTRISGSFLIMCHSSVPDWNENYFPECVESEIPKTISQEGDIRLEGNATNLCDNTVTIKNLSDSITADLTSNFLDICGNDIECNVLIYDPECKEYSEHDIFTNVIRKRRDNYSKRYHFNNHENMQNTAKKIKNMEHVRRNSDNNGTKSRAKKDKIEIKFKFIGKIINNNLENPKEGLQKLRDKINALTHAGKLNLLNNRTNQEIAKLALNLHLVFKDLQQICEPGSILKKTSCVRCPLGTFHNISTGQCNACSFGEYQDTIGSTKCKTCPKHTYTKRMHAKSFHDCISLCRPGHYSRRKRYHGLPFSLEPCLTCDIGFYQPLYGQNQCMHCPSNSTTRTRASENLNDCVQVDQTTDHICLKEVCLNGGKCIQDADDFTCECFDGYIGSRCEKFGNPCDSAPCLNAGTCNFHINLNKTITLECKCKDGYTGSKCQFYIDECLRNPCQNGGRCSSTENDYTCECDDGFEGQFCENAVNHCEPSPCEQGSTCRSLKETWECICTPGFLGRHCNLLPCDWLPCRGNSICVNIAEKNVTRYSYKCECPDGYTGEDCKTKIDHCKDQPCLNGGQCISWKYNYTCFCPVPFTGQQCETELTSDYVMHFTQSGTTDYVMMKGPVKDISQFSICLWLQSVDTFNYGTVLSYATSKEDNALTITDYNGLVLYINGEKMITDVKTNDGQWHFLCVTWANVIGSWKVYIDGDLRDNGTHLAQGEIILANGSLVIGQEQDQLGGGFSESESFLGKLTFVDVWDTVLDEKYIRYLLTTCDKYYGTLYAWPMVLEHVRGNVVILRSPFCRGCGVPTAPLKGSVNTSEDLSDATYYCDTGYVIRFDGREHKFLTSKCLKYGEWDKYYRPTCTRVRCGFPGYFPRGRIHGWSYAYGDEIYYTCSSGYKLRGNPRRVCNSNGAWSGLPPICIGITCKNLLAPEHGDIEYIIEEHERDDITILQVGQQLEFKCDIGFHLVGEKFLTCLETGAWDHNRPTCISHGCPPPRQIANGYIVASNSQDNVTFQFRSESQTNTVNEIYPHGDIVQFVCHDGYKFNNRRNLSEIKIQCSTNGSWTDSVPNCILMQCPWPKKIENAKHLLLTKDNGTIEIPMDEPNGNFKPHNDSRTLKELLVPGTQIQVICDAGFNIVGGNDNICTNNEEWSTTDIFCQPQNCPIDRHPMFLVIHEFQANYANYTKILEQFHELSYGNAKFTLNQNADEKRFTLMCLHGSQINFGELYKAKMLSNLTWTCNIENKWKILDSNMFKSEDESKLFDAELTDICHKLTCGPIEVPEHSYIVDEHRGDGNDDLKSFTDAVTFKCRHGYILQGNDKSICLSNGTWSHIPLCKPILCGKPPTPLNAVTKDESKQSNYTFGSIITYECTPGYRVFGQSNARCLANGKWSRTQSKCSKISCGKPKIPPGAMVRGRSYLYQDHLAYICPGGKKQGNITCTANGKWSDPPICNHNR